MICCHGFMQFRCHYHLPAAAVPCHGLLLHSVGTPAETLLEEPPEPDQVAGGMDSGHGKPVGEDNSKKCPLTYGNESFLFDLGTVCRLDYRGNDSLGLLLLLPQRLLLWAGVECVCRLSFAGAMNVGHMQGIWFCTDRRRYAVQCGLSCVVPGAVREHRGYNLLSVSFISIMLINFTLLHWNRGNKY